MFNTLFMKSGNYQFKSPSFYKFEIDGGKLYVFTSRDGGTVKQELCDVGSGDAAIYQGLDKTSKVLISTEDADMMIFAGYVRKLR